MGREITKVPPKFEHPKDENGVFIPGAHYELLYNTPASERTCFQIYENVSEGTPVSPIFETQLELEDWLVALGYSLSAAKQFAEIGFAPMLVIRPDGAAVDGIEGMNLRKPVKDFDSAGNKAE